MGDLKKCFLIWNSETKRINEARKFKMLVSFLSNLNNISANNIAALIDYKGNQIKQRAIDKMVENHGRNLRDAFIKWRNYNQIRGIAEAMTGEKKREVIATLQRFFSHNQHNLLRLVLARFARNSGIRGVQTRFFNRLLMTKSGAFMQSFSKWKSLPEPKDSKLFKLGTAFERRLNFIFHNCLKL